MTSGANILTEVRDGFLSTILIVRVKARAASTGGKIAAWVGLGLFLFLLIGVTNFGTLIRLAAERQAGSSSADVFVNFVIALRQGELGDVGAAALAGVVIATLVGPLTGAANQALIPDGDLSGIRPARLHRYFDGLITAVVSPIGYSQLLTLTLLASLLTLEGNRPVVLLATWLLWVALVFLSTAGGWVMEYARRRYGKAVRFIAASLFFLGLAFALMVDPNGGRTLFGAGDAYPAMIRALGDGNPIPMLAGTGVFLGMLATGFIIGVLACRKALALPATPVKQETRVRSWRIPKSPTGAVAAALLVTLWRTREVRRPIITILLFAVPAVWASSLGFANPESVLTSLTMILPLSVALGWAVNMFGVLGMGLPFLLAQPNVWHPFIRVATLTQVVGTLVLAGLVVGPPVLAGLIPFSLGVKYASGVYVTTLIGSWYSMRRSVKAPHRARLTGKGDPIVPPLTAISYTVKLLILAGIPGVALMSSNMSWQARLFILAWVTAWAVVGYMFTNRKWSDPTERARIAATVGAV